MRLQSSRNMPGKAIEMRQTTSSCVRRAIREEVILLRVSLADARGSEHFPPSPSLCERSQSLPRTCARVCWRTRQLSIPGVIPVRPRLATKVSDLHPPAFGIFPWQSPARLVRHGERLLPCYSLTVRPCDQPCSTPPLALDAPDTSSALPSSPGARPPPSPFSVSSPVFRTGVAFLPAF